MPCAWSMVRKLILLLCAITSLLLVVQYVFNREKNASSYFTSYQRVHAFLKDQLTTQIKNLPAIYHQETPPSSVNNINVSHLTKLVKSQQNSLKFITGDLTKETCDPTLHVLFLKTHKTGSSTITNILNRFAEMNNLTTLLPRHKDSYHFLWPNKFRFSAVADTFTRPNILANHARYSREAMNRVFPRLSTFYVTILRNPVSQFESSFQYFSFAYMLNIQEKPDPMKYFLDNPVSNDAIVSTARKYPSLNLIRNPLFYDLGLDYGDFNNETIVNNAINTLSHDFDLVLLTEHFDESLTLLRRRLCWQIDDVVYFKLNERLNKNRPSKPMLNETIMKIEKWNNADMALYRYFERKFWREVDKEGPDFYDDVSKLKARRKYYSDICIEDEAVEEAYSQVYVKGYKMRTIIDGDLKFKCELMLRNEIKFLNLFKSRYAEWHDKVEQGHIVNFGEVYPILTDEAPEVVK
ncbi:galactose-3-O-sulfotransferase 2-like [Clytia hemisphaerica]|uniref:Uncharacterized protein n=1 Tax=Clytia hemisphaerica TaxID=252671 RepID=A0A7M5XD18_9CNID